MNALQSFLMETDVSTLTQEIELVSPRLKGKDFKFKICAMSGSQFGGYQAESTTNANSKKKRNINTGKLQLLAIKNHTLEPNFKDVAFLKALNVQTPEAAIEKTLTAGEQQQLFLGIMDLSGMSEDAFEKDMDEVKN